MSYNIHVEIKIERFEGKSTTTHLCFPLLQREGSFQRGLHRYKNCMLELDVQEQYPLKNLTTFNIGGSAKYFIEIFSVKELLSALQFVWRNHLDLFVLGGGSNVLVHDRGFHGIVLKISMKGLDIIEEAEHNVLLKIAAGESWDSVVTQAVRAGWWGIENLSFIPGQVGALAIQNVGAYGQEAREVIESIEAYEIATGERLILTNQDCRFAYRSSIFNSTLRGKYLIANTFLRLKKHGKPNLKYQHLKNFLGRHSSPTLQEIRTAVTTIRQSKLPDPSQLGNAGSFFKNLQLTSREFEQMCQHVKNRFNAEALLKVRNIPQQRQANITTGIIKIPTALLLDICRLKGFQIGGAALYYKHPLIVVNATGRATAYDVMNLTQEVRQIVYHDTGQTITPEPNLIGFNAKERRDYFGLIT